MPQLFGESCSILFCLLLLQKDHIKLCRLRLIYMAPHKATFHQKCVSKRILLMLVGPLLFIFFLSFSLVQVNKYSFSFILVRNQSVSTSLLVCPTEEKCHCIRQTQVMAVSLFSECSPKWFQNLNTALLPAYQVVSTEHSRLALSSNCCLFTQREQSLWNSYTPCCLTCHVWCSQCTMKPSCPVRVCRMQAIMQNPMLVTSPSSQLWYTGR